MRRGVIAPQFESALRTILQAPALELLELDGARTAHDEEAQPWATVKYGPAGHDDWTYFGSGGSGGGDCGGCVCGCWILVSS